ncbi:MAG: hypothetical protein A2622_02720 [Bdellovibrionales bacterium RIFCSPHIGHO2_01_FULL_40_29]|nr:MAG: hypothetical protein A2622_02720 [Bdellovibrionales bacterium RIFCSPHIGHO2_01_FULL_40_29]OFZ33992.1 MAG: hypothetical protein A3D17_03140 [Bdellovibrionales bacterium RIFCSPHIGHO2_02_FULL_40_15]
MLEFYPIHHPDIVFKFIENHELGSATWIVSDLKSKNEIQKTLLQQQGFFLETSILRASDFWKITLRRLAPQVQIVSSDFIKIIIDNFIEKYGANLEIQPFEASTLHAYVTELAPILLHPESDSVLAEWFETQTKVKKWQRWHLLSRACMAYISKEYQVIDHKWIAAYLQTLDINHLGWQTNLIVDLGSEMSSVEMGLFRTLAQKVDVKILWPSPEWQDRFQFLLKTYNDSVGFGVTQVLDKGSQTERPTAQFVRLSTQLAEVKFTVSKIRQWIDQGISINDIAVIAADVDKSYWPILKYFLDEEGITYQKDHVVKLNSLAPIQNFLAYANNLQQEVGWESLEISLYSKSKSSDLKYETFKSLFYQLYDETDLIRDEKIKNLFYRKIDLTKKISRDEFLIQIVKIWVEALKLHELTPAQTESIPSLFELIFKDFLSRSVEISTDFKNWHHFLQSCINSKEIKLETHSLEGVKVLPLMSSHLNRSPYQVWLGLDEHSLASARKNLIPTADVFELKTKFDFAIDYPEESFYDFNIRWLSWKAAQERIYLCANSSFEAEPLAPSLFFLENNSQHDLTLPQATRHDQVQNYLAATVFEDSTISPAVLRDLRPAENIVKIPLFETMSPSDLEDYFSCPFKLLVQKAFLIKDLPQVAVDLDPRQKGSLLHQLFEHLTNPQETISPEDFLEKQRAEKRIYPQDDLLWAIQKNKLVQVGTQFVTFEKSRKHAMTVATEKSFEMYFDPELKEFITNSRPGLIKVRGRIDRIDKDAQGIIVYDYKSSTSDLKNYPDWIDAGEFQLLLYLIACEKVLYPGESVIASVYYDYRKFETSKGLMNESFQNTYFESSRKKKSLCSAEKMAELLEKFNITLETIFKRLERFDFSVDPVDQKECLNCNWSKVCRAPHLM